MLSSVYCSLHDFSVSLNLVRADVLAPLIQPDLPFACSDDLDDFVRRLLYS